MSSTRLGQYYGLHMQIAPLGAYDVIQYGGFLVIFHFFLSNFGFFLTKLKVLVTMVFEAIIHEAGFFKKTTIKNV